MNSKQWILVICLCILDVVSFSQTTYDYPQRPNFDYITIDLDTGHPKVYWTPPTLGIPSYPDPTGYIIYKRIVDQFSNIVDMKIDSVGTNTYSYTDLNTVVSNKKLTYLLASKGPTRPSSLTPFHSTIFLTGKYDSCYQKLNLSWNLYDGWSNNTIHAYYYLYMGSTPDWRTYTLKDSIYKFTSKYILSDVKENQDYYFYITAKRNDTTLITTSNIFHKFTDMPKYPSYMSVDSILAEDLRVNIYFKVDPTTELKRFEVVRWENSDSIKSIGSIKSLNTFSNPLTNYFADTEDSWAARTRSFYYKLDAYNTCPNLIKITNHANTIIPVVHSSGMRNHIQWNGLYIEPYNVVAGNKATYKVYRYATLNGQALAPQLIADTDQPEAVDDLSSGFQGEGYSVKFCYQVEAYERNAGGSQIMFSKSRIQCTEIIPGVTMPDAIAPTVDFVNNGNSRNLLVPIITFQANYTLYIYNRWGVLVFKGENMGWNGRINGGELAKEGTYVYRLVVHTSGNQDITKNGNVAVVYP